MDIWTELSPKGGSTAQVCADSQDLVEIRRLLGKIVVCFPNGSCRSSRDIFELKEIDSSHLCRAAVDTSFYQKRRGGHSDNSRTLCVICITFRAYAADDDFITGPLLKGRRAVDRFLLETGSFVYYCIRK